MLADNCAMLNIWICFFSSKFWQVLCVLLIKLRITRRQFWFTVQMVGIELPRYGCQSL